MADVNHEIPEMPASVGEAETRTPILRYFAYDHLPPDLAEISSHFHHLAYLLERNLPNGPEKSVALRKLLEGKDAAVRSALDLRET